ncbi:hypothetical protein OG563_44120 [Nocardia vinacea]|uniref:Uncharacterized protein n=1 Tax=Nocardia vinacea TaxID=96468 RepID=A0ABZ1YRY4_9NOCA|nr:hypothetical protein [Nocardia vinacea]
MGTAAVNTWNARRAAVAKWLSWCRAQGWDTPTVPTSAARSTPPDFGNPVRSRTTIDRRDIQLREKTLWRMLYETCAHPEEPLQINGPGRDLRGLRHSGLTHLGESGAGLLELMAKSRHRKAENLRRYFKPHLRPCAT